MAHRTCSIPECDRKHYGHGLCMMHWHRWRRHGDPLRGKPELPATCSVEGCGNPRHCRGWCVAHYVKWKRYGTPLGGRQPKPDIVYDGSGCWLWNREIDGKGYGMYRMPDQSVKRAHRVIYEQRRGPIPTGLELDHLCRVKRCVNPDHLEPVTHAENVRRAGAAKTHCLRGHLYVPMTTYRSPNGGRSCQTCRRMFEGQKRPKVA